LQQLISAQIDGCTGCSHTEKQRNLVRKAEVVPSPRTRTIRRTESRNTLTVYCIYSRASVWV